MLARRRIMYKLREWMLSDPSQRWIDGFSDSALTTTTTAMAEIENVSNGDTACDSKLESPSVSNCVGAAAQFRETIGAVELNREMDHLSRLVVSLLPYFINSPIYIPRAPLSSFVTLHALRRVENLQDFSFTRRRHSGLFWVRTWIRGEE